MSHYNYGIINGANESAPKLGAYDPYNDFDYFVINFLTAGDPVDYLMEEVTRYAISMENFYLYKLYQASRSDDADIGKLLTS